MRVMDKLKILVVDDESRMRKLVRDFLEREGYAVLEAGDGMEAMDIFYSKKPRCSNKIFRPSRIRMIPPTISALFL